jgi:hypothetical protein
VALQKMSYHWIPWHGMWCLFFFHIMFKLCRYRKLIFCFCFKPNLICFRLTNISRGFSDFHLLSYFFSVVFFCIWIFLSLGFLLCFSFYLYFLCSRICFSFCLSYILFIFYIFLFFSFICLYFCVIFSSFHQNWI